MGSLDELGCHDLHVTEEVRNLEGHDVRWRGCDLSAFGESLRDLADFTGTGRGVYIGRVLAKCPKGPVMERGHDYIGTSAETT